MNLPISSSPYVSFEAPRKAADKVTLGAAESFAAHAEKLRSEGKETETVRGFRDLPGYGRIETVKITETVTGPDGKQTQTVKELAVCPECGTVNCACLARVTLQQRLDEENAKGVRGQEKPEPMALLPQTFNHLAVNLGLNQTGSGSRMFG